MNVLRIAAACVTEQEENIVFTIETRINGALIQVLYGHNEGIPAGSFPPDGDPPNRYSYRMVEIATGKQDVGTIDHRRGDGIAALVAAIYRDVDEQKDARFRDERIDERARLNGGAYVNS